MGFEQHSNGALAAIQREQTEKLGELETVLREGFSSITKAIDELRDEVQAVRKSLIDSLVRILGQVITTICWAFAAAITVITGIKGLERILGQ